LHERLASSITFDPLRLAPHTDPGKVFLVLARFDRAVPFRAGWQWREALGGPETLVLPSGHYTALFYLPYIQRQVYEFFRDRFAEAPGNEPAAF
jgi:hypothetical protein